MPNIAPFSTFVVGSLPRPQWVRDLIEDRKAGRISNADSENLLDDAVPSAIRMQERAGLDYVSDGEWRRESYVKVFADSVDGFESDLLAGGGSRFSTLPYPAVTSALKPNRSIAADEARFLKDHSTSKNIVAVPSPYTIARRMWDAHHSTTAYLTRGEFMDACIPIIRDELRSLVALGVEAIQLDDPWLALLVDPDYRGRENITDVDHEIEMSVRSVNEVTEGLDDSFISVHLCHAHFARRHSTRGSYELIIEALGHMNVDRFAIELATPDAGGLEALKDFPSDKILGLGAIDHTDKNVETPELVIQRVENAMQYVPAERITLNPDCGFAPSSANPMDLDEAYLKLSAMCQAANILKDRFA
ncbi:MAG: cobalamin-independent methionine synthase II family protein [SAR202 cluster bacterium]|jgi:5-methyltetrahydropteroyltriglutamate--homocysteine methyltransferase|nr:cobalamin-independent methionine synthase II family protein [SAR202 cluster bacterium]MDP6716476.1 cobalamin-independent methionine synthase II family protein [SAR202 cluster bacterium]